MDKHYDCLIVGAGISGIFTAREILKKHPEWNVALAEAYKTLGGRTFSYTYKKNTWEGGAGRISKDHKHLLGLIKEYKLNLIPIGSETRYKTDGAGHISLNTFDDFSKTYLLPMTYLSKEVLAKHTIESLSKLMYGLSATRRLFEFFPYRGEINTLRADLALKTFLTGEMSSHSGYFVIKEGFSELVLRMKKDIVGRGCKILTSHRLLNLRKIGDSVECFFEGKSICTERVILAIDCNSLAKIPVFRKWDVLSYLKTQPLFRIYGVFNKAWFPPGAPIVTPGPLRYIIPVSEKVIMVSYTDAEDTQAFHRIQRAGGDEALQKVIMKELRKLFPDIEIPEPVHFKSHYWHTGATYWLPGNYVPETVSSKSIRPLPLTLPKVWLTGESTSMRQAWVEGALEQSLLCLSDVDRI
jgi:hypothetical protein